MTRRLIHLVQGDARRVPLSDKSVQCAVTSPPFWGLRDYGIPPSIWGGDDRCEHDFGVTQYRHKGGPQGVGGQPSNRDVSAQNIAQHHPVGQFCTKCSAWRGCLGLEPTPELFVEHIVEVMREVRRVLRDDGTLWLNLGDSYSGSGRGGYQGGASTLDGSTEGQEQSRIARGSQLAAGLHKSIRAAGAIGRAWTTPPPGLKQKDLVGIPWMVAFALRADGWYLRQDNIWSKPNPMPESVTDRCTKAHEYMFLLTKSQRYYYDADAIREPVTSTGGAGFGKQNFSADGTGAQSRKLDSPVERNHPLGRNKRSVWTISTESCREAHFATFPRKLVRPCILAGTSERGCCPACGAPWKRAVERVREFHSGSGRSGNMPIGKHGGGLQGGGETLDVRRGPVVATVTTHWAASCKCNAGDPIPCRVLDPFNGAATTGIVCLETGREYIGIERKPEYIEISKTRLAAHAVKLKSGDARPRQERRPAAEPLLFNSPSYATSNP